MTLALTFLVLGLGQAPAAQAPAPFQAVFERGVEALAAGELAAAEEAFRKARALQPQSAAVYYQLGEVFARRRQFGDAVTHFRRAIELEPNETQFYFRLAVLQAELKRFHDAYQTLDGALRARPDVPTTHLLLGRVAGEQGDHARAEGYLREYVRRVPEDTKGLGELGVALLAQEKFDEAEALFQQVLSVAPDSGIAHYNLGFLYSRRGEQAKAAEHLEAAVRMLPEDAGAHYRLGAVRARQGEHEQAEESFRRALALDPENLEVRYALGTLLRQRGRVEEAAALLGDYERRSAAALEVRERSRRVSAFHQDVRRLLEQDRLEEARSKLERILALDPGNDLAHYRRAQIHFLRQEFERALEAVQAALARKDVEPAYAFLEAMCWERLGRSDQAAAAYQRVIELADYPDAYAALGRLELGRGNAEQAVARLGRAVALEPDNADFRLALAEALAQAGRLEESRQERARAQALKNNATPR